MVFSFFKKPEVIVAKPAAKPGGAARPLNGSEPVEDVGMASEPAKDLESSQSGLSDFVFSESAPQFHLEPEIDPVDADAQEAAILFANAQDSAARTVLENAVRHHAGASSERLWRMLFDLYHLLGDQVAFLHGIAFGNLEVLDDAAFEMLDDLVVAGRHEAALRTQRRRHRGGDPAARAGPGCVDGGG